MGPFFPGRSLLIVCLPAVAFLSVGVASVCAPLLPQGDTFWHLKAGEWIIDHRAVPKADPFSWTAAGAPWHAHEWLWEALAAFSWRAFGKWGLWALTAAGLALAGAFSFLFAARRSGSPAWALACCAAALPALAPFVSARPHVLACGFLIMWLWLLDAARERKWAAACLPLLAAVWSNAHASVPLGALAGIILLAADALPGGRGTAVRQVAGLAAGALAAGLNPWGFGVWKFAFEVGAHPEMVNVIDEWLSPDFHSPFLLPVLALGGTVFLLPRGDRAARLLASGAFLAGLVSARHLAVFALLWPTAAAPALAARFGEPGKKSLFSGAAAVAAAGIVIAAFSLPPPWPGEKGQDMGFPVEAVAFMKERGLTERVFNHYTWGGYLNWEGVKPFVDGRADMYVLSGSGVMEDYDRAVGILRPPDPEGVFAKRRVKTVLVPADSWLAAYLSRDANWEEVYRDGTAAVFARRSGLPPGENFPDQKGGEPACSDY
jgi:hypothetical protein